MLLMLNNSVPSSWLYDNLPTSDGKCQRLLNAFPLNPEDNRRTSSPPQSLFHDGSKISTPGRYSIDVGNDVSNHDARLMGRSTVHELSYPDPAIGTCYSVDPHTRKAATPVRGGKSPLWRHEQQKQKQKQHG